MSPWVAFVLSYVSDDFPQYRSEFEAVPTTASCDDQILSSSIVVDPEIPVETVAVEAESTFNNGSVSQFWE